MVNLPRNPVPAASMSNGTLPIVGSQGVVSSGNDSVLIDNPMIIFWRSAQERYVNLERRAIDGEILLLQNTVPLISDLGQAIQMLFGRHWDADVAKTYAALKAPRSQDYRKDTPHVQELITKYYPEAKGWKLEDFKGGMLFRELMAFWTFYTDVVKHFDHSKYEKSLNLDFDTITRYMEIVRQTWIWFDHCLFPTRTFNETDGYFADFVRQAKMRAVIP